MFLSGFIRRSSLFLRALAVTFTCAFASIVAISFGCGKPFNVRTQPGLPPASYSATATAGSVSVQAKALTDEDLLYDIFDANLIAAGALPVRVVLTNGGGQVIELKEMKAEVRSPAGRSYKAADARKVFKRLVSYYEISAYNKSGYKASLRDFSGYAFDLKAPLAPGESRQGLLFFFLPSEAIREAGLIMVVSKLSREQSTDRDSVELKLDEK